MLRAIRALLNRRKADRDFEREIAFHIENETAKNVSLGMAPDEAHRRARVTFGSIENTKEQHRDGRGARWLEDFVADVRYAFRQIRRAPVFTVVAVAVLAVGIGVNSALVAFIDAIANPRVGGIERSHELVFVERLSDRRRSESFDAPLLRVLGFRDQQSVFSSVGGYVISYNVLAGVDATQDRRSAAFVTGDYFRTVRPRMAMGRLLPPDDDRAPAADASAVISYDHWRVAMGADSAVIGGKVAINGVPTTIVGVLAQDFTPRGASNPGNPTPFWLAFGARNLYFESDSAFSAANSPFYVLGRLNPGASVREVAEAVRRHADVCQDPRAAREACREDRLARSFVELPPGSARTIRIVGLVLSILTGLILAIACANLSILLLGRAVARRREIAVRLSLGAGRRRVVRQLLTESLIISSAAAALGIALLTAFRPISRTLLTEFHTDLAPNWKTVVASLAIAMLTTVGFGLVPALHATRASVATALKEASAGFDRGRARLQRWFVIAEVTISIALVSIMGLFVQAVHRTTSVDPGYDVSPSVLIAEVPLTMTKYTTANIDGMLTALRARLVSLPGVEHITLSTIAPARDYMVSHGELQRSPATGDELFTQVAAIDESYFAATGVRIRAGRGIGPEDSPGAPYSVVVSSDVAATMWPGQNAVGRVLTFSGSTGPRRPGPRVDTTLTGLSATVVGVADSVGESAMSGDPHLVYLSRRQWPTRTSVFVTVRTNQTPTIVTAKIVEEIHAVDPSLPVGSFQSTKAIAETGSSEAVQAAWGAVIAGGFALALACVGLFAVVAFAVAHRSREIGIRVALGATHDQVVRKFFGEGMRMAFIGFVVGVPIAIAFMRIAQSQVMGVPTLEAKPIALVVGVLLAVTAIASWLPARRATRVDPIESLRSE